MTVNTVGSYVTETYPQNLAVTFDDVSNVYTFTPDGGAKAFTVTAVVMATLLQDLLGALPQGDDVIGADGDLVTLIPEGYYDGTKSCTASDKELVPANIVSGETIFGVHGA
jgi:hypothetical protein